ncbi:LOW QUALITY PROTEIN: hypothetical protein RJ640_024972 [Escallonia rubra]|uniref:Beta-glucosidase n=1 Tax=Escallonia rubra TaxID=112253 RepID=A0AA88QMY1_9ASTE|nr:LOW QUALITY PROTEIN: hypothetical protein RJ640_020564 [Escallonia rubra]KAK2972933.1 LOW QUALITY PROTEIN: hypothetical protein RJ640_024972 [Escallonia rubra]
MSSANPKRNDWHYAGDKMDGTCLYFEFGCSCCPAGSRIFSWMVYYSCPSGALLHIEHLNISRMIYVLVSHLYMDPLVFGDYSRTLRSLIGSRLPRFTAAQTKSVKGSLDFLGLNYYTANYAAHLTSFSNADVNVSYTTDNRANLTTERNGVPIGEKYQKMMYLKSNKLSRLYCTVLQAGSDWLYVYPQGVRLTLLYIKEKYNNPIVYITENGIDEKNNASLTLQQSLTDNFRIMYYQRHLLNVVQAIKEGADVRGFFAWAIMDNFEWDSGYTSRFGLNFVDFANGLKRYPKLSAKWFQNFLKK